MIEHRLVSWFSCGAASAVATKLAIESKMGPVTIARCWIKEEHPDNDRFAEDCEAWFGQKIITLKNEQYGGSVENVIIGRRYMSGVQGSPCTTQLKKNVRLAFQKPGDIQVFGYTFEEQARVDSFIDANNDVLIYPILVERKLTYADCLHIVQSAGIELPAMYKLGYKHNNCIGCVKGGAGYWNKVRLDFPGRFASMSAIGKSIGAKPIKLSTGRIGLHELEPGVGHYQSEPEIQCGIACELVEKELNK